MVAAGSVDALSQVWLGKKASRIGGCSSGIATSYNGARARSDLDSAMSLSKNTREGERKGRVVSSAEDYISFPPFPFISSAMFGAEARVAQGLRIWDEVVEIVKRGQAHETDMAWMTKCRSPDRKDSRQSQENREILNTECA